MKDFDDDGVADLLRRTGVGETVPALEAWQKARGWYVDLVAAAVPPGAPYRLVLLDGNGDEVGEGTGDGLYEAYAAALADALERAAG